MAFSSKFRILLTALALIIGSHAIVSAMAEVTAFERATFPADASRISSRWTGDVPSLLTTLSPFGSELQSNHALIAALQAIQSGQQEPAAVRSTGHADAVDRVTRTLSISPYNPELWLALALLQAQRDPHDPVVVEALKMAYFIAPNDARLMPVRIDIASRFDALAIPDVKDLVRNDVQLILTRRIASKWALVSAYRRASDLGKAFLKDAIESIDPSFLAALRR
ncbi:hypothetical protein IVB38_00870 [Bradyrhizobium sp. 38]|uniref:hypothetical protein n=1 Tax=unclassified Bradyrhizobium TaxID=2631580 RepID=UPI001FFA1A8D|nr:MULTISPECIES: hypothetical protein [unclassified Bradyrhizobium]MCK1334637.1 hypothetical protein [Bradyrhizobium sp. 38]MCK1781321.1 hypothetical protein [Bradyrhizobium sp. 132]